MGVRTREASRDRRTQTEGDKARVNVRANPLRQGLCVHFVARMVDDGEGNRTVGCQ